MLNNISSYLNNLDYRITYYKEGIHVLNYNKVIDISDSEILINIKDKKILIKGENFRLVKLDKIELLINGNVKSLEIL